MTWNENTVWEGSWNEDARVGGENENRPWDGFFRQNKGFLFIFFETYSFFKKSYRQSIDEMRKSVQDYMFRLRQSKLRSSLETPSG